MSADSSGKISLALGGKKKPAPTNGVKRSHKALRDNEEDEDGEHGRAQTVSHFNKSAGGAIDEAKPRQEKIALVIAPQANRDWKDASQANKRQRRGKVESVGKALQNGEQGGAAASEEPQPTYGLNVFKRSHDEAITNSHASVEEAERNQQVPLEPNGEASVKAKTDDERALEALLGKQEKSDLVLPAMTEDEAFSRDYTTAPEMSTLADYDRVPVEEFGAALLRGMGWKDGEGIGVNKGKKMEKTKLPEQRPALLGIGAKEEAAVAQELGTWGKAAKDRKGPVQVYNPVLLRDKKTGEMFTEEELQKKRETDKEAEHDLEFEREEEHRKAKERRRRDRDGSRDRDSDRRVKERRHDRRDDRDRDRRRRDDGDEEYYRRKKEEKRRRERDRENGDHDSERSRRHHSDGDRHRDRHHDRR